MKSAVLTPIYLSVSWVLTVTYQLFTETAVKTIALWINVFSPSAATWLSTRIDMVVFVYAFTWIFLLSSVIPSVLLGKGRSVLVQYFVCLIIAFLALFVQSVLLASGSAQIQQIFNVSVFLSNPALAAFYLFIPYLVMLGIDTRSRKKRREAKILSEMRAFEERKNAIPIQSSNKSKEASEY